MIGSKVLAQSQIEFGIGEIAGPPDSKQFVQVDYYVGPVNKVSRKIPRQHLSPAPIPSQTRCYHADASSIHLGRVIGLDESRPGRAYVVRFPNGDERVLDEADFHVRSHLRGVEPVDTLAQLAHESPYLFERRNRWLREYYKQESAARGLVGLISSKVELFPHQVEVVRRVLSDPTVRYLLADEVGLGKTIEAGAILRQLSLDAPELAIHVFVPSPLVRQWTKELEDRFGVLEAEVHDHEELLEFRNKSMGVLVIDEAHRIVEGALYEAARAISDPKRTKHVLLLSATPVLHHEKQLLALLELLDPALFGATDLKAFRRQLEGRKDLGRTLLALSRASQPAFIARHARKCADLLPEDPVVTGLAAKCAASTGDADAMKDLSATLRTHLTETYRLHRRLLRTRRAVLVEEGDLQQRRTELPTVQDGQPDAARSMWLAVEEWRTKASAYAHSQGDGVRKRLIADYMILALLAASRPRTLVQALKERAPRFPGEAEAIEQILSQARRLGADSRSRSISELLRKLDKGRWVAFSTEADAVLELAKGVAQSWGGKILTLTEDDDPDECADKLDAFKASDRVLLIADQSAEEGLNLQIADGLFLADLPFAPMRIEQRLGRLDRLDRVRPIRCYGLLSCGDSSIALDAAWYEVLSKGLGVFKASVADLQFMVEQEVTRFTDIVFDGGPQALIAEAAPLATRLDSEREASAEQDILDGLYVGDLRTSATWQSIEEADQEEAEFGEALVKYAEDSLRLKAWKSDGGARTGTCIQFKRQKNDLDPLIPAQMLVSLGLAAASAGTVSRSLASKRIELELYRPGQAFVDEVRDVAEWDERGQAFAMWRASASLVQPRIVFRSTIRTGVVLRPIEEKLAALNWDPVSRASLIRLLLGWLPTQEREVFLESDGTEADAALAKVCEAPYSNESDINLGGKRSQALVALTGERAWGELCREMAGAAKKVVEGRRAVQLQLKDARHLANEHFDMIMARLRARSARDGGGTVDAEMRDQGLLRELVAAALEHPAHRVDTIGVYVLSKDPVCAR